MKIDDVGIDEHAILGLGASVAMSTLDWITLEGIMGINSFEEFAIKSENP